MSTDRVSGLLWGVAEALKQTTCCQLEMNELLPPSLIADPAVHFQTKSLHLIEVCPYPFARAFGRQSIGLLTQLRKRYLLRIV